VTTKILENLEGFRAMMRGFPTGVAIVTTLDHTGRPAGLTCSSMCSVSLEPPMLLVCVRAASPTLAALLDRGRFAVNLLHGGAQAAAELFASGDPDRFRGVTWHVGDGDGGPHLGEDAHAVADCRISSSVRAGDHTVVFGKVYGVTLQPGRRPLLYGNRRYTPWPYA
jgi:flavin reductase (NADH)